MNTFGIGSPLLRIEDKRLIEGNGRYTDDVALNPRSVRHRGDCA
jgi:hypothetical protein